MYNNVQNPLKQEDFEAFKEFFDMPQVTEKVISEKIAPINVINLEHVNKYIIIKINEQT